MQTSAQPAFSLIHQASSVRSDKNLRPSTPPDGAAMPLWRVILSDEIDVRPMLATGPG
jgi:hypothetical protein